MVLGIATSVSADSENNNLVDKGDKLEIKEVKAIKDDLKIYKITDKETKVEKYALLYKEHNQDAPKNLPKVDEKTDLITDESSEIENVWVDRVYFKGFNTLEEAEDMAISAIETNSNSEIADMSLTAASYGFGNGSYIERGYSPIYGNNFHIHWSPDDAAYLKDSLSNWVTFYSAVFAALTWIGGAVTGIPGTVVAAFIVLISNQMIYSYYYNYKNTDGSFDIYIFDRDVAWVGFQIPANIITNIFLGKARAINLNTALKFIYWYGENVYVTDSGAY